MSDDNEIIKSSIKVSLSDKSVEKRRQAAAEIEAHVRSILVGNVHSLACIDAPAPLHAAVAAAAAGIVGGAAASAAGGTSAIGAWGWVPATGPHELIAKAIKCLAMDFCDSAYPNRRKGGLVGLAAIAIAAEHRQVQEHVFQLVPPVLTCFSDEDQNVRYAACESFYNIAKVARVGILPYLEDVFDGLCRLYADVESTVKEGAQCLDRLVKDIVTECRNFQWAKFVPALTIRLQVLNPSVLQLVLGWIDLLDSAPQVDMIEYLPQYLEGLFNILRSDNRDIRHNTEVCLKGVLTEIKDSADERPVPAQRAIAEASSIVAQCCRAGERGREDNYVRLTALHWLLEFVQLQCKIELQGGGGIDCTDVDVGHTRWRQCSAISEGDLSVSPTATFALKGRKSERPPPGGLRHLVPVLLSGALHCLDDSEGEIRQNAEAANAHLRGAAQCLGGDLPVEAVVDAVLGAIDDGTGGQERSPAVLLKCFGWAQLLFAQCPRRVLQPCVRDRLLEAALAALARSKDEVAVVALRLIAQLVTPGEEGVLLPTMSEIGIGMSSLSLTHSSGDVASGGSLASADFSDCDLYARTCHRIFKLMAQDGASLSGRCELVIQKLCEGADVGGRALAVDPAERFFAMAARAVAAETDSDFSRRLVRILNRVLLTSRETRRLRARLRDDALAAPRPGGGASAICAQDQPPSDLIELLKSWFHCPVSTIALCLWLHWFELAAQIATRLTRIELTQDLHEELLFLVELFESPIFVRVRLQLIDSKRRPALLRTLLGLIAVLPREPALRIRLEIVESCLLLERATRDDDRSRGDAATATSSVASGFSPFKGWPTWSGHFAALRPQEPPWKPDGMARATSRLAEVIQAHGWQVCAM